MPERAWPIYIAAVLALFDCRLSLYGTLCRTGMQYGYNIICLVEIGERDYMLYARELAKVRSYLTSLSFEKNSAWEEIWKETIDARHAV